MCIATPAEDVRLLLGKHGKYLVMYPCLGLSLYYRCGTSVHDIDGSIALSHNDRTDYEIVDSVANVG